MPLSGYSGENLEDWIWKALIRLTWNFGELNLEALDLEDFDALRGGCCHAAVISGA